MKCINLYAGEKFEYFKESSSHDVLHPSHRNRICDSSGARLYIIEAGSIFAWGRKILIYDKEGKFVPEISLGSDGLEEIFPSEYEEVKVDSDVLYAPSRQPDGYYHWVTENLPLLGLIEDFDIKISPEYFLYIHRLKTKFQREYLNDKKIPIERILSFERKDGTGVSRKPIKVFSQRLIVAQFRLVNGAGWVNGSVFSHLRKRYDGPTELHDIWKAQKSVPRLLYVKRGESAIRRVINESELLEGLEARGFVSVVMEGRSLDDQAHIFRDADYIIGPHGAGLSNIVFTKKGAHIMEYCGGHVSNGYRSLSLLCGHSYHVVSAGLDESGAAIPVENRPECGSASFFVDVKKIFKDVDHFWNIF